MKVIYCEPGKEAQVKEIGNNLDALQEAVGGGWIEAIYPFEDEVALVCNDEGKFNGSEPCRGLRDSNGDMYDVIFGPFFICGLGEEDFTDIPEELIEKYLEKFLQPEVLMDTGDKYQMVPYFDIIPFN